MRKLHRPRRLALPAVVLAMAVLFAVPVCAPAAEEPGTRATSAEVVTEPAQTEPPVTEATAPSASTGWVPQDDASEAGGDTGASTQRGSSLGSGGSSKKTPSASEQTTAPVKQPAVTEQPASEPVSSGSHEAESPAPATGREPAPTPPLESEGGGARAQVTKTAPESDPHLAVAAADPVAQAKSKQAGEDSGASAVAQVASTSARLATGSGGLPWPALIVCGLILLVAGGRLVFGPIEADSFRYSRFRFVRRAFR